MRTNGWSSNVADRLSGVDRVEWQAACVVCCVISVIVPKE